MDTLTKIGQSYDSLNRQWRSADAWRGNSVCQIIGYILDYESPRKHASSIVAWKALRWKTGIPTNGSMVKNHIPLRTGFGSSAITENFVPIVVPGLSSSSSASSSTSRTPMKQESHSSSSSSSSSSSPTVGEIPVREREDTPDSAISPMTVSTKVDDRSGQPVVNQANKIPKNPSKGATDRSWATRCEPSQ